jgi:hypothetical protein
MFFQKPCYLYLIFEVSKLPSLRVLKTYSFFLLILLIIIFLVRLHVRLDDAETEGRAVGRGRRGRLQRNDSAADNSRRTINFFC